MSKYVFNGFLFSQRQTGVMRYAKEILEELDKLVNLGEIKLIVPSYAQNVPNLENIEIVYYGHTKGILWEQIDFYKYLRMNQCESINFNNTFPILKPGIIYIHDIAYKLHPEFGTSLHGKLSNLYHRIIFFIASKSSVPIITVSYFSKYQLIDYYHIDPNRIYVIEPAWQHYNKISCDDSILKEYKLRKNEYYFSLGSLSKMKNTKWFVEAAKNNANEIFVLAGAKAFSTKEEFNLPSNVITVGYISDEQVKSLIQNCKAFIYPSLYDGFGIPPLEALSQNANVLCSSAASLTEVYGNTVHYIDPYDEKVDINKILEKPVAESFYTLNKYSWKKSAVKLYRIIRDIRQ